MSLSSSPESEKGKFDEVTFRDMKKHARIFYEEVANDHDARVEKYGPDIWRQSREENEAKKRFASAMDPEKPISKFTLSLAPKPIEGAKECVIRTTTELGKGGGKRKKVPIRRMDSIKSLPAMSAWVSTLRNYAVDDEPTLTHIPYTEGEDHDKFVQDLVQSYSGHVHGYNPSGFANDRMIFEIIAKLTTYYATQYAAKTGENVDSQAPPDIVFETFAAEFPDKGTGKELQKYKYPDLLERFDGGVRIKMLHDQMMPNIDGKGAISTSRERAMHTYASLFCRRCYVYDCNLHGPPAQIPRRRVKPDPEWDEPPAPCGPNCFLNNNQSAGPSQESDVPLEVDIEDELSPSKAKRARQCTWSARDETMFRVYRESFGDRYCDIAFALGNKDCRQVQEFALKDGKKKDDPPLSPNLISRKSSKKSEKVNRDQYHRFRVMKWAGNDAGKVFNTHPYNPCDHPPGFMCTPENCQCAALNNACMKFCYCSSNCANRFPGCRCKAHCNTKQCPCFMAMRECDPDLCSGCGANDFESDKINCTNVAIQRSWKQHLLLAPSDVAGWGTFLKNGVKKGDFIYEYTGELISQDEAERRGKIYDRTKTSYLFNLNNEQAVDATRKGNLIRFANHSRNPNCCAKVMMVNGDHRIGIYAQEDIEEGEELFFDYRYSTQDKLKFVSIERPRNT